jgi:PncC family amidohydrolase
MVDNLAEQVAQALEQSQLKLVLAESCTGGKAASLLTAVPGASNWFCGSAVTYREPTKQSWLGVSAELLRKFSAESQAASDALAMGVLEQTPEADLACAITGHLGPIEAPQLDGQLYLSLAVPTSSALAVPAAPATKSVDDAAEDSESSVSHPSIRLRRYVKLRTLNRIDRQAEAAGWMLGLILEFVTVAANRHIRSD